MPTSNVNIDQWVEMFRTIGLSDDQMHRWHAEFLESLGIAAVEIRRIRLASRETSGD